MKKALRLLCAVCCAAMIFSLAACSGSKNDSSASSEASSKAESSAVSSEKTEPTPEATEEPDSESSESESSAESTASSGSNNSHTNELPVPEVGSEAFRTAFKSNPIDQKYADDMEIAGSVAGMITACNTASDSWKTQIDSVYKQILERGDEKTVETVKEEQSHWVNEQSDKLQEIRDSVSEDDPLAAITVAESIMAYYRDRAIDLCAVLYDIDGALVFG